MTDKNPSQSSNNSPDTVDTAGPHRELAEAVSTLFGIGRLWASHGLDVARSALHASAITLSSTAKVLGDLADRFDPELSPSEAGEPEPSA